MLPAEIQYLKDTIRAHIHRFFSDAALATFDATPIHWGLIADVAKTRERAIVIPTDVITTSPNPSDAWKVPFGHTELTLWNALRAPSSEWRTQDPNAPLWHIHLSGTVMPAWNLAPTLFGLLTLQEEKSNDARDQHDRFVGRMSPRAEGLLESPIFNDSVAALVAACVNMARTGLPGVSLDPGLVRPPVIVLSHDLDQLRGNDLWTQFVRLSRVLRPQTGIFPDLQNFWFAILNTMLPRRYYFDNIVGMIAIERMLGFSSTHYFLNGSGGRFGARSGSAMIPETAAAIPVGWDVGIHYNFDTYLNNKRFLAQRKELEALLGCNISVGRAHYLRFDPFRSWRFLLDMGIQADESLGYPDRIGYRAGVAGPFRPYDIEGCKAMPFVEMPLVVMESTLLEQYPDAPVEAFERLFRHIAIVGGAVSLLFHPGFFHNPEHSRNLGLYRRILGVARHLGARSMKARDFID